jgi:hypothetical protein
MRLHRRVILLLFIATSACTNWQQVSEGWQGRTLDELVASWGVPASTYQFADGRKAVAYTHSHAVSGFNPYATYQTVVYQCAATFTSDSRGVIVKSEVSGNSGGCGQLLKSKPKPPQ